MLVLSRKKQESVVISGGSGFEQVVRVTVLGISADKVKLGFEAGGEVPIHRAEVWERISTECNPDLSSGCELPAQIVPG